MDQGDQGLRSRVIQAMQVGMVEVERTDRCAVFGDHLAFTLESRKEENYSVTKYQALQLFAMHVWQLSSDFLLNASYWKDLRLYESSKLSQMAVQQGVHDLLWKLFKSIVTLSDLPKLGNAERSSFNRLHKVSMYMNSDPVGRTVCPMPLLPARITRVEFDALKPDSGRKDSRNRSYSNLPSASLPPWVRHCRDSGPCLSMKER